jgi:hypothetical protein
VVNNLIVLVVAAVAATIVVVVVYNRSCWWSSKIAVIIMVVVISECSGFYSYFRTVIVNLCYSTFNKVVTSLRKITAFNAGAFPHCCNDGTRLCSHWRDNFVFIWICRGSKLVCEDCHHISTVFRTAVITKPL